MEEETPSRTGGFSLQIDLQATACPLGTVSISEGVLTDLCVDYTAVAGPDCMANVVPCTFFTVVGWKPSQMIPTLDSDLASSSS